MQLRGFDSHADQGIIVQVPSSDVRGTVLDLDAHPILSECIIAFRKASSAVARGAMKSCPGLACDDSAEAKADDEDRTETDVGDGAEDEVEDDTSASSTPPPSSDIGACSTTRRLLRSCP